jgi:hypothetical protein
VEEFQANLEATMLNPENKVIGGKIKPKHYEEEKKQMHPKF